MIGRYWLCWMKMKGTWEGLPAKSFNNSLKRLYSCLTQPNFCAFFFFFFLHRTTDKRTLSCSAHPLSPAFQLFSQTCWWTGSRATATSLLTAALVMRWAWRCSSPTWAGTRWAPWLLPWCPTRTSRMESWTMTWRRQSPSSAPTASTLTRYRLIYSKQLYINTINYGRCEFSICCTCFKSPLSNLQHHCSFWP